MITGLLYFLIVRVVPVAMMPMTVMRVMNGLRHRAAESACGNNYHQ